MFLPRDARASAATVQRSERSKTTRSAGAPSTRPTEPARRDRSPRTPPGPVVSASIARASGRRPASTAASRTPSAVSRPLIPLAARPNSTALSTSVCGAWSVAIASAVPSSERRETGRGVLRVRAAAGSRAGRRRVRRRDERLVRPRVAARLPRPAPRAGDPLVGQREVMRRDVAGDRQAGRLGAADEIQRRAPWTGA